MDESSGRERPRREREANGARLSMATGPGSEVKIDNISVFKTAPASMQDGYGVYSLRLASSLLRLSASAFAIRAKDLAPRPKRALRMRISSFAFTCAASAA